MLKNNTGLVRLGMRAHNSLRTAESAAAVRRTQRPMSRLQHDGPFHRCPDRIERIEQERVESSFAKNRTVTQASASVEGITLQHKTSITFEMQLCCGRNMLPFRMLSISLLDSSNKALAILYY